MDSVSPQNKALIAEIKKDADTRKFGQGGNGLPNLKNFARIISEKKTGRFR